MLVEINNDNPIWRERSREQSFWIAKNADDSEPESYPVAVKNVNGEIIGTANNKDEYILIWNANPDNAIRGYLLGDSPPFVFDLAEDVFANVDALLLEDGDEFICENNNDIIIIE